MPVEDTSSRRERRQTRRASALEDFQDWLDTGGGQDVMDRIRGLDLGEGQIFDRQVGSGRLSVNLPTRMGDPKIGSVADFMRDPQGFGEEMEQEELESALRATYTIPIGGGAAAGGQVGTRRRPRYMNEGGIASLMSNGGLEAMMLELEGEAPFDMQEAYDEELGILDSADSFDSLSMREIGEMIVPGGGGMKMGMAVTKVGKQTLREIKKMLAKTKKPPPTIIEREIKGGGYKDITKEPPPTNLNRGGSLSYKKGYYGKSYK